MVSSVRLTVDGAGIPRQQILQQRTARSAQTLRNLLGPIRLELLTPDIGRPFYPAVATLEALAPHRSQDTRDSLVHVAGEAAVRKTVLVGSVAPRLEAHGGADGSDSSWSAGVLAAA